MKTSGAVAPSPVSSRPGGAVLYSDQDKKGSTSDFVVVDQKSSPVELAVPRLVRASRVMGMTKGSKRPVAVRLAVKISLSASAAAITTVIPLEPSTTSEWSAFASLFDEMKVESAEFDYRLDQTTAPGGAGLMVLAYDPLTDSALGNVVSGCEFEQHQLSGLGVPAGFSVPLSQTGSGLRRFTMQVPKGSARSAASTATFSGEWSSTGDAANTYGWIKPYVEATSTGTIELNGILYLNCRFRSRS